MKFMNMNKWTRTYREEANEGSEGSSGDPIGTDETDGNNTPSSDNDEKAGDDASPDDSESSGGIKLGEDDEGADNSALESYADFVLPDGVEMDQAMIDKATPLFKEAGLSQEMAQKFVDMRSESVAEATEALSNQHVEQVKTWEAELKADKEIGGDNLNTTLADSKLALSKVGSPELVKWLDDTGVSNNPEMIRLLSKVGAMMKEDNPGETGLSGGNSGLSAEQQSLRSLYPHEFKDKGA